MYDIHTICILSCCVNIKVYQPNKKLERLDVGKGGRSRLTGPSWQSAKDSPRKVLVPDCYRNAAYLGVTLFVWYPGQKRAKSYRGRHRDGGRMKTHLGIALGKTRQRVGWESYWREGFRHPGGLTPNATMRRGLQLQKARGHPTRKSRRQFPGNFEV